MNDTSILDGILKQQHYVEGRANALSDSMEQALIDSLDIIVGRLAELQARMLKAESWQQESLAKKKDFLTAQAQSIQSILSGTYQKIDGFVQDAIIDTVDYASNATSTLLASTLAFEMPSPRITIEQVKAWQEINTLDGLLMSEWLRRLESTSAERITQSAREALIQGMTIQQASSHLRKKGVEGTRPQTQALSRTFLLSAANYAREQIMQDIGNDIGFSWLYVATLDGRTCPICGADDGKVFSQQETRPSLPRHVNCRCVLVPTFDDSPKHDRPATKHSDKTVQHRDGSTSTKFSVESSEQTTENYNQWLKRQLKEDPAFVKRILGKARFELFSKGELTLQKMVVDNRIRTLAEL